MMQQINLYQPMFRKEKKVFSSRAMMEVTVVVLLLLFTAYGISAWNISRLASSIESMQARVDAQQEKHEKLKTEFPQKTKNKLLAMQITRLETLASRKEKVLQLLSGGEMYGNQTGFSKLFTGFARQHPDDVWLDELEVSQGGAYLNIRGNATSRDIVPKYIQRLSRDQVFNGREFSVFQLAEADAEGSAVHFTMSSRKKTPQ